MTNRTVAIAIPYYTNELTPSERISLQQCIKVLGTYDIFLVSPNSLEINPDVSVTNVQRFDDECFKSINGYNRLMLSEAFYQRFAAYDYVLIYQLDAFVFRDELQYWADKGYDYIGGPRIHNVYSTSKLGEFVLFLKRKICRVVGNERKKRKYTMYNNVGNGGLSLRRVEKMIEITRKYKEKIESQLDEHVYKNFYPEDWWLMCELQDEDSLKKPSYKEALGFAFDVRPQLAFLMNNKRLPFCCHGFSKPKEGRFWKKIMAN